MRSVSENVLSVHEVVEKFSGLAKAVFSEDRVDKIIEAVILPYS